MTSTSTLEMLNQELEGETHAIARYKENIAQAEALGEYGLHCILEDILLQGEAYKRDLLSVLNAGLSPALYRSSGRPVHGDRMDSPLIMLPLAEFEWGYSSEPGRQRSFPLDREAHNTEVMA